MKKPQIPQVPSVDPALQATLRAMKENIELLCGTRGGRIETLSSSASTADIIAKVNAIIDRINA